MGETFFGCAERETLEETGLVVRAEKLVAVTNDVFDAATRHYITVFVLCRRVDETQEPMVRPVLPSLIPCYELSSTVCQLQLRNNC